MEMLAVASSRAAAWGRCVSLGKVNAEHLAFPDGWFDTAVATLVLCSVVDQHRALDELRRVLRRPGGRLLLLEHTRPHVRPLAWLADVVNLPWYTLNKRCHLNRETQQAVIQAGFGLEQVESRLGGLVRLIVAHT
jgi:ubiquinone/menaquinone biosynthesis C-methylase UbiE